MIASRTAADQTAAPPTKPAPLAPILLNRRQVSELTGLSIATVHRLRAEGKFPPAVCPVGHPKWRRVDVERWAERLKATKMVRRGGRKDAVAAE